MSDTFALLVLGGPITSQAPDTALAFAHAAVAAGHRISCVFFLHDGVYCGNVQQDIAGQPAVATRWAMLPGSGTELVLCVTSAMKRGILDATQAARLGHGSGVAAAPFVLGGLGLWIAACAEADHVVSFGA